MLSSKSLFRNVTLALTLTTAAAAAQTLDARPSADPASGLATYTIDVTGRPNTAFYLMAAPMLAAKPLTVAGVGTWYLDMKSQMGIGTYPIDSKGVGRAIVKVPTAYVSDLNICWQAVLVDPFAMKLTFTTWGSTFLVDSNILMAGPSFAGCYKASTRTYTFGMVNAPANANISISVNGVPACATHANRRGKGGASFIVAPPGLQAGDTIQVYVNGKPFARFTH